MTSFNRREAIEQLQAEAGDIERLVREALDAVASGAAEVPGTEVRDDRSGHHRDSGAHRHLRPIAGALWPTEILIGIEDVGRYDSPCIHFWVAPEEHRSTSWASMGTCEMSCPGSSTGRG